MRDEQVRRYARAHILLPDVGGLGQDRADGRHRHAVELARERARRRAGRRGPYLAAGGVGHIVLAGAKRRGRRRTSPPTPATASCSPDGAAGRTLALQPRPAWVADDDPQTPTRRPWRTGGAAWQPCALDGRQSANR